jgi:hypothetical protein
MVVRKDPYYRYIRIELTAKTSRAGYLPNRLYRLCASSIVITSRMLTIAPGRTLKKSSIGMSDMHPAVAVFAIVPHPGQCTDLQVSEGAV